MLKIDWWNKPEKLSECTADCFFYPNSGEYRGNIYKDGKAVADYVTDISEEIEKKFPGIFGV